MYINIPPRLCRMWEVKGDCYNTLMAMNVRRDTVATIMKSLRFRDNTLLLLIIVRLIFNNLTSMAYQILIQGNTILLSINHSNYLQICPSIYLSIYLCIYISVFQTIIYLSSIAISFFHCSLTAVTRESSLRLQICPFIYLSIYMSIYISICVSIYQFLYVSIQYKHKFFQIFLGSSN